MSATAANLIERVLPPSTPLRQWVLTVKPVIWEGPTQGVLGCTFLADLSPHHHAVQEIVLTVEYIEQD